MNGQQLAYCAILVATFGLLVTERLRKDLAVLLAVVALYVTGTLGAREALAGFSSEPAIVICSIFVLCAALTATGVSRRLGRLVGRAAGGGLTRMLAVVMPSTAALAAFEHHVTITALLLPVMRRLSAKHGVPLSKLLLPLSFAASLGTTITIIGAPAFLVASEMLKQAGRPGLNMFSIAPIGIALSLAGTAFMLLVGRFVLPTREAGGANSGYTRLGGYLTEVVVPPGSPWVDRDAGAALKDSGGTALNLVRDGRALGPPDGAALRAGDALVVEADPDALVGLLESRAVALQPVARHAPDGPGGAESRGPDYLVQLAVAPESRLAGRTLGEVGFLQRYGALVLGLWRRSGPPAARLGQAPLRPGDVLLLEGAPAALGRLATDRDFAPAPPFAGEPRRRGKALLAGAIMLTVIACSGLGLLPLEIATLAGATAVVLTGCITARQAYRAIDHRIFVFIAGAIPLGTAMDKTGTSKLLAAWLQHLVAGWPQMLVLLALFAVVALLTQFMSDAATTALIGPIAVALAGVLGMAPEPFVVTVAMAAVTAFLTPLGHHGNLLVYGPGGYKFADFFVVGAPLTLVVALIVAALAPVLWPGPAPALAAP
jgi:di/tricarboxylate transporter